MTDTNPYRAPDAVLDLERKLHDKSRECEDLRSEVAALTKELEEAESENEYHSESARRDRENSREHWTWRLVVLCVLLAGGWLVFQMKGCDSPGAECRDGALRGEGSCPYPGQTLAPAPDGLFMCTCPTPSPASSK